MDAFELSRHLRLLQLADSGLPIGGLAHSFGLESMIEDGLLGVEGLAGYLRELLREGLLVESVYARAAHGLRDQPDELLVLNARLSALRLRERLEKRAWRWENDF